MKLNLQATKLRRMMPKWTKRPTRRTRKKMVDLARVMADRQTQLTEVKPRW
jgi:hypothetical protein